MTVAERTKLRDGPSASSTANNPLAWIVTSNALSVTAATESADTPFRPAAASASASSNPDRGCKRCNKLGADAARVANR